MIIFWCLVVFWDARLEKMMHNLIGNFVEKFGKKLKFIKYLWCSTSPPGGNQVDGLPPAASLTPKFSFYEIYDRLFWPRCYFYRQTCYFNSVWHIQCQKLFVFDDYRMTSRSSFNVKFLRKYMKKWCFKILSGIILGRFLNLQDIKKHDFRLNQASGNP